ncbi:MAG: transposase [Candidatus Tectomicrobia bacterium]|uniref:Transposase n=1 Tax=Tectimicrobiota bacterium TaxID=2528274 RepID=A0A932I160_UNCTE|nr:transposase [Candidatus Tectomicrobia bacterium]
MPFNPDARRRRSVRLKGWDYASRGAYFITICVQGRECRLGEIAGGKMRLSEAGAMVHRTWEELPLRFPNVGLDAFVVMPNHLHGILVLKVRRGESRIRPLEAGGSSPLHEGEHKVRPYGTLPWTIGRIVQAFKSTVTRRYAADVKEQGWPPFSGRFWQRNFYEHILRDEAEWDRAREYVLHNPLEWAEDENHPQNV